MSVCVCVLEEQEGGKQRENVLKGVYSNRQTREVQTDDVWPEV